MRHFLLGLLLLVSVVLRASSVLASGFASPAVGPTNYGVTSGGPLSVHFNPAGLGYSRKIRLIAGGALILGDLRYQRERRATYQYEDSLDFALPIDPSQIDPNKTGLDVTAKSNPVGVMPALFLEVPIGPVALGFGVYVPYAAKVSWPEQGPQRWQLQEATMGTAQITQAISYHPNQRFSFGLAGSLLLGFANLSKVQDMAAVPIMGQALARPPINQRNSFGTDADPGVRELDALSRPFVLKNAYGIGGTFTAGVMGEIVENVWLAGSYQHWAKMNMSGDFSLDMNDPFFTQDLASQGIAYKPLVKGTADLRFMLPAVARAGIRYDFGKAYEQGSATSLALEGSFSRWSVVDNFKVQVASKDLEQRSPDGNVLIPSEMKFYLPRHWHDTYGAMLRVTHRISEKLMLWGLAGYESGATPDRTIDAASPDGNRITGAGGLAQDLTRHITLSLDLVVQSVIKRHVLASDYDLANGTYQMRLFSLGAYGTYAF